MHRTVALVYTDKTPELSEVFAAIQGRCIAQEFPHAQFFDFDSFDYVIFFQGQEAYSKVLRDKIELTRCTTNKVIFSGLTSAPGVVAYKIIERIYEAPSHPSVFGALQPLSDYFIPLSPGKEVSVQFEHTKSTLEEFAFRLLPPENAAASLLELRLFDTSLSKLVFSHRVPSSAIRKDGYARVELLNPYRKKGPIPLIASILCLASRPGFELVSVGATRSISDYYLIEDRMKKPGAPAFYTR